MDTVTGVAGNTMSSVISVPLTQQLIQEIDDIINLDDNRELLEEQLCRMKSLLLDINSQFQYQQKEAPDSLNNCLLRMQQKVGKARELIHRSQRPLLQQCIDCLFCKPKVFKQIREWNSTIRDLHDELRTDFSVFCSAQQIVSAAAHQAAGLEFDGQNARHKADALLQDEPDTGLVGLEIKSAEPQLQSWVSEGPNVRVIGVCGMGGVGKTTLLKKVYNTYKVSNVFDHIIWVTVAQSPIRQIQNDIAAAINLNLANSSADMGKMKLCAYLKSKKFFLVLDDMWKALSLKELGVQFGKNKGSKLVFTTRNRDLIREMNAKQFMEIQPLRREEAWELFLKVAFEDGHVPENIQNIARKVGEECKGLPLAIKVTASTMRGNADVDEWKLALKQMQKVDLNFPITHPRINGELYQRLRWSYDSLPDANLKNCFLYCAMFTEGASIPVEAMAQLWIAEGLVKTKEDADYDYVLKTGESYVKVLVNRCLFQVEEGVISVHDVLHDMAIYIGESEENCVLMAGQSLQRFPDIPGSENCRRISVLGNDIKSLPAEELRCPKLVSLFLGQNEELKEIPDAFLLHLTSLRVLGFHATAIRSLPTSMWQLTHLEFLFLSFIDIEDIPEEIGHLSYLQFLYLHFCRNLKSLPSRMGELKNLKYLNLNSCNLMEIPDEIRKLPKCEIMLKNN